MDDRWFTDSQPSARWPHSTRANAGEVMPSPVSPLCQTFTWDDGIIHGAIVEIDGNNGRVTIKELP